jgi:hypothetical protein
VAGTCESGDEPLAYWILREEASYCPLQKSNFGSGYGPVVKTECMMMMMMMIWSYRFYESSNEMSTGVVESFLDILISF